MAVLPLPPNQGPFSCQVTYVHSSSDLPETVTWLQWSNLEIDVNGMRFLSHIGGTAELGQAGEGLSWAKMTLQS